MERRQLLNFLSVCEEKNITIAADRCFITRQGLSKSLRQLEDELGIALFERNRNGVTLTEYGRVLKKAAEPWLKDHDRILQTIKDMREKSNFQLSVVIADSFERSLPVRFFSGFLSAHPEINLSIMTIASKNYQEYLLENELPVGITAPPIDGDKFDCFLLLKKRFLLVVGRNHRLAGRTSVKMEELRGEEAITRLAWQGQDDLIAKFCAENGIKTNTRLSYLEPNLLKDILETGRYIIFASEASVLNDKDHPFIEVEDADIHVEFYLVVNKQAQINTAVELFIAWTREQFARVP